MLWIQVRSLNPILTLEISSFPMAMAITVAILLATVDTGYFRFR